MPAQPSVSIVLPVRNGEAFLEEALASLAAQTHADYELVVQDDGSTDRTAEIVAARARSDDRVVPESGPARGVAAAANRAAARARGTWLVRMDADDVARPERIAKLLALAADHPAAGFLASRVRYFPREHVGPGMARYEAWINALLTHDEIHRDRFVEYPLPHPSTAIRRDVWDALGGYRDGPFPEDYDLFLRAAGAGVTFAKHPDVLLDWREGEHRTTRNDGRYGLDRFLWLKVQYLAPLLATMEREVGIVGAGADGKRLARTLVDAGTSPRWFVDVHPGRIGNEIHGAHVVGYDDLDRLADAFLLVAVGREGGRDAVRRTLAAAGRVEERDFLCVQ